MTVKNWDLKFSAVRLINAKVADFSIYI